MEKLKILKCEVLDTETAQAFLRQHLKLTKFSLSTKKAIFETESFDCFPRLFPDFLQLASLKEVDISYGFQERNCNISYSGPVLSQIESLTIRDARLSVGDMRCLAAFMPSISKLALLEFCVRTEGSTFKEEHSDLVRATFLAAITEFSNLTKLYLEYDLFSPYEVENVKQLFKLPSEFFEALLIGLKEQGAKRFATRLLKVFLSAEKLPKLRRLACNCFNMDDSFEVFCKLASNNPKQWYAFKEFDSYSPPSKLSEAVRSRRPRNVRFF